MAEFLTTNGIVAELENLIKSARNWIMLVSPYVSPTGSVVERLVEAERRGVKISLIYGKREDQAMKELIGRFKAIQIYFYGSLHAKCYCNESAALVTSLNLTESSPRLDNREMGVLFRRRVDSVLYQRILDEVGSIKAAAFEMGFESEPSAGFCIRCNAPIPFDPARPYCYECYKVWNDFGNDEYREKFCHECGKNAGTTMANSRCKNCSD